jgi:integrase
VCIPKTKTGISRSFVITEDEEGCDPCVTVRKYISLRPAYLTNKRLLIGYRNKKCVAQVVGVHTVGNAPRKIAEYLGLADANQYTGHCFRRSSASLLVEGGGDLGMLMTHGGWKSVNVARGYVEQSTRMKTNIAKKLWGHLMKLESLQLHPVLVPHTQLVKL